jgi:hypothetical protein
MELARLISDLEPEMNPYADFMLAFRWDTEIDHDTARYLARKFRMVYTFKNARRTTGWPDAPNDLFLEAYTHFAVKVRKQVWDYSAALFFEPDCVPLARDWIKQLYDEWHAQSKMFLGFIYAEKEHPLRHVNGNLLISPKYLKQNPSFQGCSSRYGWDCYFARSMLPLATESRLIYNDYAKRSITEEELFSPKHRPNLGMIKPVLYHGCKGHDALVHVKKRFGLK